MTEPAVRAAVQHPEGPQHQQLSLTAARNQPADGVRGACELNDHGYIMPGLGDAGDRIFGTR